MSAYACESCGKQFARPAGLKSVTFCKIKGDGTFEPEETWILCRPCGTKLAEMAENAITGGELLPDRRRR